VIQSKSGSNRYVTDLADFVTVRGMTRGQGRWGKPEEMAELFAFCVSARAGYLTGTDILNDGGVVAPMKERARVAHGG
jgi:NAD(P)-dependent dehydrogenase (short-subunit alcohol dehydrogenase family)